MNVLHVLTQSGEYKFHGKDRIVDFVEQSGCIQYDPIDICGKNHELVIQSRIPDFSKEHLYDLLYKDRVLIDLVDKNMAICLLSDYPYFEHQRVKSRQSSRSKEDVDKIKSSVLDFIEQNGPVCSSDLEMQEKVDWSWAPTTLARAVLDTLYYRGDLIIHHKKNTRKFYDLTQRHISQDILDKCIEIRKWDYDKILEWNILRRIKSVGMLHQNASYAFIGIRDINAKKRDTVYHNLLETNQITQVKVNGIAKPFFISTDDINIMDNAVSDIQYDNRIEFLAPLDNLLWDRKIIIELFDFDYKWEIYTPKIQRKYGYYTLPILYGENFVGRIELVRNKEKKKFDYRLWLDDEYMYLGDDVKEKILSFESVMY